MWLATQVCPSPQPRPRRAAGRRQPAPRLPSAGSSAAPPPPSSHHGTSPARYARERRTPSSWAPRRRPPPEVAPTPMSSISCRIRRCLRRIRRIRGRPREIHRLPSQRSSGGSLLPPKDRVAPPVPRNAPPRQVSTFKVQIPSGATGARHGFAVRGVRLGGAVLLRVAGSIQASVHPPRRDRPLCRKRGGRQRGAAGPEVSAPLASCVVQEH
jgi:hypothetical protein